MSAKVVQVIITDILRRGQGSEESPIRIVKQIWTLDGELIAEIDPWPEKPR